MSLAADGLAYQENINLVGQPGEVEVIQYVRPNGIRRKMFCQLGEEYVKKAENLIIGVEDLGIGKIALYCRMKSDPESEELIELANNGPYPPEDAPVSKLKNLIDAVLTRES